MYRLQAWLFPGVWGEMPFGSLLILLWSASTLGLLPQSTEQFPHFFLSFSILLFLLRSISGYRHKVNMGSLQFPSYLPDSTSFPH